MTYHEELDAGRGRCPVRRCWLVEDLRTLPTPEQWVGLRSIAWVQVGVAKGADQTKPLNQPQGYFIRNSGVIRA